MCIRDRRFGTTNLPEFFELLRLYDLSSTIENISVPFLSIASIGEGRHIVNYTQHIQNIGKSNMTGIILDGELDGADAHCHLNNLSRMHAEMYGWLDKVLN